jgi:hypothetical protein
MPGKILVVGFATQCVSRAGFAGGKADPAPDGSCPLTTGVSNFEHADVRF